MSSVNDKLAIPAIVTYCMSKGGVSQMTRATSIALAPHGIRVNAICPGSIDTPMLRKAMEADPATARFIEGSMPIGRLGKAEEIAEAVVWLCSDRASLVTGHSMGVDGGSVAR